MKKETTNEKNVQESESKEAKISEEGFHYC